MFIDEHAEPYPIDGTLEEKAEHGMEQVRAQFFGQRDAYDECREGTSFHNANILAFGKEIADRKAKSVELNFQAFCKNALLTIDGQTTDPRFPVDKMVNRELRRIRAFIILKVSQYMDRFSRMMPEKGDDWSMDEAGWNMTAFQNLYNNKIHDEIHMFGRLKPPNTARVVKFIGDMILNGLSNDRNRGFSGAFLSERWRDQLIEFLLQDIPFNNKRMDQKTELIADEQAAPKEEKPVLH